MLDEHVGHVLFADLEMEGEGAVVVAGEELHAGGFDGGDDEAGLAGGDLPEGGGAGLLDLGVGREVFEGEDVVGGEAEDGFGGEGSGELAGARTAAWRASAALLSATMMTQGAWRRGRSREGRGRGR